MLTYKKCGSRLWSLVPFNKASIDDTSDNIKFVSLSYFIGYVACQSIWLDKMCGILCMLACKLNKLFPLMVLWDHIYQMHCYWMRIPLCDSSCTYTLKSYTMDLQFYLVKRLLKQWWSTIPLISTKRTIASHLNSLNTKQTLWHYNPGHNLSP